MVASTMKDGGSCGWWRMWQVAALVAGAFRMTALFFSRHN